MIAGIELGGGKTVVAIGTATGLVQEEWRFPTTTPAETFGRALQWFAERGTPEAIGVAAFGPIGIVPGRPEYGKVIATPKPGWKDFSITGAIAEVFPAAKVTLDTDVNAAVLAEARLGAGQGVDDLAYITIGTGIGAGILSGGHLIHGALHPEFGHIKVPRCPGDEYPGICSFHKDCLEGLASGPSIAARWGQPAAELPRDHAAWDTEAWYLAHGVLSLLGVVSSARVIIGGGVSQAEGFHEKTERILKEIAAGYFVPLSASPYVVPPLLEQQAGIVGALLLTGI
ncbi:ROK family protein [Haloferula sp. BvORR071]|uniref:ROK family protein n=1 Tax=Haloferula sp. BvORR071 TaxID=1396141 RepID=UPI0005528374|nr:ROK family protein [Haloferula sp. BvORR071]